MTALASRPGTALARPAFQGPSHAWLPWAGALAAAASAALLDRGVLDTTRIGLIALAGGLGAYLAFREPPPRSARGLAWVSLGLAPLAALLAFQSPELGATLAACAVAGAHAAILRRSLPGPRGVLAGQGGLALALAVLLLWRSDFQPEERWLLPLGVVLVLELTWLPLLLRARRAERDPRTPMRFRCPRCAAIQSRAEGKGACASCGLFILLERAPDSEPEPLAHPEPTAPLWLLCPTCRLRLWAPRGRSACPQCRTELWAEWNVHVHAS